jgi:transglutaminase-like putative cysteine protease
MSKILIQLICWVLVALTVWHGEGTWLWAQSSGSGPSDRSKSARKSELPLRAERDELRFDERLVEIRELVHKAKQQAEAAPHREVEGFERLRVLRKQLAAEAGKARTYLAEIERLITKKKLPAEILRRHQRFVRRYEARYWKLTTGLDAIEAAQRDTTNLFGRLTRKSKRQVWNAVLGGTLSFLEATTPKRRQTPFDPHSLPHRSLKADKPVAPKLTREEWLAAFPRPEAVKDAADPSRQAEAHSPVEASAPPASEDLAETIEVQFTPEITQLAADLEHNPVKIYNWVHNNIEFMPTWGSIQGAQQCLMTRSGNSFDTASVLIALLRVSGIPARYQMGTIEVPIAQFLNWSGGFTDPDAAASMFASSGTPSVVRRVDQAGNAVSVKLEHVWVTAFVDYVPSRGAIQKSGDSWIELDPSFKQHDLSRRPDMQEAFDFDLEDFAARIAAAAQVDPATGSITGVSRQLVDQEMDLLENQSAELLATFPGAAVQEFQEAQGAVILSHLPILAGTFPYRVLARSSSFSELPAPMRHGVSFWIDDLELYSGSLPELAGKRMSLSFVAAAEPDRAVLESFVPQDPNTLEDLPVSLPAYLVQMRPELRIHGRSMGSGTAAPLGQERILRIQFSAPTVSTPEIVNTIDTGEYLIIGLNLAGISDAQIQEHIALASSVQSAISQGQGSTPDPHELFEAVLSPALLLWFVQVDRLGEILASSTSRLIRFPSLGFFFHNLTVQGLFGAPVSVSGGGLQMDIDRDIVVALPLDGNPASAQNLTFITGLLGSALEAALPKKILESLGIDSEGISTVHGLDLANAQRIPIYSISQANAGQVLPLLSIHPSDRQDIEAAVQAGLTVMVPQTEVQFQGRSLLPLIIEDPETGSASFLIAGANGSLLQIGLFAAWFLTGTLVVLGLVLGSTICPPCIILVGFIGLFLSFTAMVAVVMPGFLSDFFTAQPVSTIGGIIALVAIVASLPITSIFAAVLAVMSAVLTLLTNLGYQ